MLLTGHSSRSIRCLYLSEDEVEVKTEMEKIRTRRRQTQPRPKREPHQGEAATQAHLSAPNAISF